MVLLFTVFPSHTGIPISVPMPMYGWRIGDEYLKKPHGHGLNQARTVHHFMRILCGTPKILMRSSLFPTPRL